MDFLKKNYEKILLVLVLLGLTAAVVFLLIYIPEKQQQLKDMREGLVNQKVKPLDPLDTQPEETALQRLQTPYKLDLTTKHRLFNPVLWQVTGDGRFRKIDSENQMFPAGLKLAAVNAIYSTVTFVTTNSVGFVVRVDNPTAAPRNRMRTVVIHQDGSANELFNLKRMEGSPDSPTALDLEYKDTHEAFTLVTDPTQPFKKVVGYTADLKYPLEPSLPPWNKVRIGTVLHFEGADYTVIDVKENSVVISAKANNKHTTIFLGNTPD